MKLNRVPSLAILGLALTLSLALAPCQAPSGAMPHATPKAPLHTQTPGEQTAWLSATKAGTPEAFMDFYQKYPHSAHIKAVQGTLRGRFWEKLYDPNNSEGVLVTVEGMNVLKNLSVHDAVRLEVIGSIPREPGKKITYLGQSFNYVYLEICQGDVTPYTPDVRVILEPRDNLDSTILLSADGKHLLSWDLSNSHPTTETSGKPTFLESAATEAPFNTVPAGLDKNQTAKSQSLKGEITLGKK